MYRLETVMCLLVGSLVVLFCVLVLVSLGQWVLCCAWCNKWMIVFLLTFQLCLCKRCVVSLYCCEFCLLYCNVSGCVVYACCLSSLCSMLIVVYICFCYCVLLLGCYCLDGVVCVYMRVDCVDLLEILATHVQRRFAQANVGSTNTRVHALLLSSKHL